MSIITLKCDTFVWRRHATSGTNSIGGGVTPMFRCKCQRRDRDANEMSASWMRGVARWKMWTVPWFSEMAALPRVAALVLPQAAAHHVEQRSRGGDTARVRHNARIWPSEASVARFRRESPPKSRASERV